MQLSYARFPSCILRAWSVWQHWRFWIINTTPDDNTLCAPLSLGSCGMRKQCFARTVGRWNGKSYARWAQGNTFAAGAPFCIAVIHILQTLEILNCMPACTINVMSQRLVNVTPHVRWKQQSVSTTSRSFSTTFPNAHWVKIYLDCENSRHRLKIWIGSCLMKWFMHIRDEACAARDYFPAGMCVALPPQMK